MDQNVMFKISYGLFVITAKESGFDNGCIINTTMQVTETPNQVVIAVNKANKTHDMIKETKKFNLSMLSENTPFEVFKQFGYQSGKTVDKFADFKEKKRSSNGLYYITTYANAYISADVVQEIDLQTHTLFIAKVTDGDNLSESPSVTYTYYQDHIKPKLELPKTEKKGKTAWLCKICGFIYEGEELPPDYICPICKHGVQDFEKIEI